jgi:hypothetical protein
VAMKMPDGYHLGVEGRGLFPCSVTPTVTVVFAGQTQ